MHNITEEACEEISGSDDTCRPPYLAKYSSQERCILQTRRNMYHWYSSLYGAIRDATFKTSLSTGDIVAKINPEVPGHISLNAMLSALVAGFAFLAVPEASLPYKLIATSVGQSFGLAKTFFPSGSLDSEIQQIIDIDDSLGKILDKLQANLADALIRTQTDFGYFMAFAANGSFLTKAPSFTQTITKMGHTLKTYVVSQALQANGIIITIARNTSAFAIAYKDGQERTSNGISTGIILPRYADHINCSNGIDEFGVCDNWWIDPRTNDSYALYNLNDIEKSYGGLLTDLIANGWTTGQALFLGSQRCFELVNRFNFNSPFPTLIITSNKVDAPWFSNVRVCTWNQSHHTSIQNGQELETSNGCRYAWSNFCSNDQPYKCDMNAVNLMEKIGVEVSSPCHFVPRGSESFDPEFPDEESEPHFVDLGYASLYISGDNVHPIANGSASEVSCFTSRQANVLPPWPRNINGYCSAAYNGLYDRSNVALPTLQRQAYQASSRTCENWPGRSDVEKLG